MKNWKYYLLGALFLLALAQVAMAQTDSTAGGGIPLPTFTNVWSLVLYVGSILGIPYLVDKMAPVTWTSTQKTLALAGLAIAFSIVQLLAEGKFDLKNVIGTFTSMLGFVQLWYQLLVKRLGWEGPKTQILDIARQQIAHQIQLLSHTDAKAVLDPSKPPSITLKAEVK
jgi:hypothetical protein